MSHSVGGIRKDSFVPDDLDDVLLRTVGTCPTAYVSMNGVKVPCILDTGSQVTTISECFFCEHFFDKALKPLNWLKLTAANGLDIPYAGYIEIDIDVCGVKIPKRGVLVLKDSVYDSKHKVPALVGMNVISQVKEKVAVERPKRVDDQWANVLRVEATTVRPQTGGFARVAGKMNVRVPGGSIAVLRVTCGHIGADSKGVLIERLNTSITGNLILVDTFTE